MTQQELGKQIQTPEDCAEEGISLIDIVIAVGEEKWTIFWIAFVCAAIGVVMSLRMTDIYTAKTTFLPPQQSQSGAANALASLGGLAGMAGGSLGIKSHDEMYVTFLQSATLQNNLIARLNLQAIYKQEKLGDVRAVLSGIVKITADKKAGLISVEVDDKSPAFAAELANNYVVELRKMLENFAVTDAQQRRVYFERLIVKTKDSLAAAELKSKIAQNTSGIISLDAQATSAITASSELRAQIAMREVQIQATGSYATARNPDMQRLAAELAGLRNQLDRLEQGSNQNSSADKSINAMANLRAFREVKYQEAILETLIKQYEVARVEEAKEGPLIQQLDVATAPERKSKPRRSIVVLTAAMGGLILGFLIAFLRRGLRKAATDPVMAESLKMMWQAWRITVHKK